MSVDAKNTASVGVFEGSARLESRTDLWRPVRVTRNEVFRIAQEQPPSKDPNPQDDLDRIRQQIEEIDKRRTRVAPAISTDRQRESVTDKSVPKSATQPIVFGTGVQGTIASYDERDLFKFTTSNRTQGKTRLILRKLSSAGFDAVEVYDNNEEFVASKEANGDRSISFVFESTPNSTYFISISCAWRSLRAPGEARPPYPYELELREE